METFIPRYWPYVRGMPLTKASDAEFLNVWVNNRGAGDLRRHRAHYDVILRKQGAMQPHYGPWKAYTALLSFMLIVVDSKESHNDNAEG